MTVLKKEANPVQWPSRSSEAQPESMEEPFFGLIRSDRPRALGELLPEVDQLYLGFRV